MQDDQLDHLTRQFVSADKAERKRLREIFCEVRRLTDNESGTMVLYCLMRFSVALINGAPKNYRAILTGKTIELLSRLANERVRLGSDESFTVVTGDLTQEDLPDQLAAQGLRSAPPKDGGEAYTKSRALSDRLDDCLDDADMRVALIAMAMSAASGLGQIDETHRADAAYMLFDLIFQFLNDLDGTVFGDAMTVDQGIANLVRACNARAIKPTIN